VVRKETQDIFTTIHSNTFKTPATPPFSSFPAAFLEVSQTSATDPKYGVSVQQQSLPSDASRPPCYKFSSWSVLELHGIFWEDGVNISDEEYRGDIRYVPLSRMTQKNCILHDESTKPS